jgi:hypothetical protein
MCKDYILIPTDITDWEWIADNNVYALFINLLLMANCKDKKWKGITIKKGQLVTKRELLSFKTGLSVSQIRTALKKLESSNDIIIETTNKFSIITIVNYDNFDPEQIEGE